MRFIKNPAPLLIPIIFCSCNLFNLPSPPEPSRQGQEVFPDKPEKVLINFKNSIDLLYDKNIYLNCYSSDFMFFPDNGLPYPLNQPWNKQEEDRIISNILYSLDFSLTKPSNVDYTVLYISTFSDSAYIKASFDFRFVFKDRGEKFARSSVDIILRRNPDGRWVITKWYDFRVDTVSFGEIKFYFK